VLDRLTAQHREIAILAGRGIAGRDQLRDIHAAGHRLAPHPGMRLHCSQVADTAAGGLL
jgi:hypothetical protein